MKSLKEYMTTRKYVCVNYTKESQNRLREWAQNNGFDLSIGFNGADQDPTDFNFHTTIFYSTNDVYLRNQEMSESETEVFVTGFDMFGDNKDIPVLILSYSGGLKDIREHFERLGLEDKYPRYRPHISLSYVRERKDVSKMELPDFRPKFDKIAIREIKD